VRGAESGAGCGVRRSGAGCGVRGAAVRSRVRGAVVRRGGVGGGVRGAAVRVRPRMSQFVGAVDQGTTSTRFMVFDEAGREGGAPGQLEHRQILPAPRWVEHDPVAIAAQTDEVILRHRLTVRDGHDRAQGALTVNGNGSLHGA